MKQFLLLFSLSFLLVGLSCDNAAPPPIEGDQGIFNQGLEAYNAGNYDVAFKKFYSLAQKGYPEAQYNLGVMYYYGYGVTRSYTEAAKWYKKAAEQGFLEAQYTLGIMYYYGYGVTRSYTEAFKWYKKAAEQGYPEAQHNLGVMYTNGHGVTQSYAEAFKWYKKAAEQGAALAQNNLGVMYANGHGVTKSLVRAYMWATLAVENETNQTRKAQMQTLKTNLSAVMTTTQISQAQQLAADCKNKNYKNC